ncbi:replication initiation protein [Campylobacter hyointestinalis]|uniref:RepE replication protein, putative n=4 Tax=Campylobacter hyointestinalis TaxID=198 RepID=A0A9W5EYV3_CAMHY|nr:replication initiation protein [Campylobacter hyointestinalis]PPB57887.1 replication initiation protein [Campylobacter hyointestinalis subsp. hyointestinalis]PPB67763.1 replication initiation protein [Campylobacter hyointestinalis subsp. hyointestinalis]TWO22933.1 replication initiation protein [Campylobacter hyointestinalis]CUU75216.1 RepE replication protein%2C putative [Campylobacter hyointestinalis subsp. hyointestinalis]CUU77011.1 RepE replication protein%2C putative [Campylobacter hyo
MSDFSFYFEKGEFVLEVSKKNFKKSDGSLVFKNKMNSILFPVNFTARDYDIFFTICWFAKQKGYVENKGFIEMPYSEIVRFFDKGINKTRFNDEVKSFANKVLGFKGSAIYRTEYVDTDNDEVTTVGVFFIEIEAFRNKQILRFKINPKALDILFGVLQFMKINLYDFVAIKGKFAKTLYRLLLQYENIKPDKNGFKFVNFSRSDFERLMAMPDYYESSNIDTRVILPSVKELNENYFEKLIFEKQYLANDNKKIIGYSFKFILKDAS